MLRVRELPLKMLLKRFYNYYKNYGIVPTYYKTMEKFFGEKYNLTYSTSLDIYQDIKRNPLISIVVPIYNTKSTYLREMILSVLAQTYSNFELCLLNAGSNNEETVKTLSEFNDPRIIVKHMPDNMGIADNTNEAIKLTNGEFIAFLDHDDIITSDALFEVIKKINLSDPDIIYSDEDKITENGLKHIEIHKKPTYSPDTLKSYNYICHFLIVRKSLIVKSGGLRSEFDGAQDYDLILRLASMTKKITHISKVLYHWRINSSSTAFDISKKGYALKAGHYAISDFVTNQNVQFEEVNYGGFIGSFNIKYSIKKPCKNEYALFIYGDFFKAEDIHSYVSKLNLNTKLIYYFSLSHSNDFYLTDNVYVIGISNNKFVEKFNRYTISLEDTSFIIFIYDTIEIFADNWDKILVSNIQENYLSIVTTKILNKNRRIHTFGLAITDEKIYNIHENNNNNYYGYMGRLRIAQNYSAVSPEIMIVRVDDLLKSNGLNPLYQSPMAFIDFGFNQIYQYNKFIKAIPDELFVSKQSNWYNDQDNSLFYTLNSKYITKQDPFYPLI
ncbi:glycosyltransferase [Paenibacillus sp. LMG 31460]|uniref:Glycosyltransferase n=1 Tax=Paenibacillus germinis TaxID=2654979 RepID=A0ABX1Z514_9BACL|nr:glycosyltransferase [Paenibacillus germinis]NOU87929.1 glycosyltransferase [Paenibacillus germinis]